MPEIMYVCLDCGHVFENPTNDYNRSVDPCDERAACPVCRSDNYDEAEQCADCEEWFAESDLKTCRCKSCLKKRAETYAKDFVVNDPSLLSDFAWWLDDKLSREGE